MSSRFFIRATSIIYLLLNLVGCEHDTALEGHLAITFDHEVNGQPLLFNEMMYENAAGNPYEITEIQWFISDVWLVTNTGKDVRVTKNEFHHYVDTNLPATLEWTPANDIPAGYYAALKFTFGLKGDKNIPGQFPDLPEAGMMWPYALGGDNGGYHYLKMNGFWRNANDERTPFNFHLGVGQNYDDKHNVTEFIQNWFIVTIPVKLVIENEGTSHLHLVMDTDKWFGARNIYDFNQLGGTTMTDKEKMSKIIANGAYVFSIGPGVY